MPGMEVGRRSAFRSLAWGVAMSAFSLSAAPANPAPVDDQQVVAALDIEHQAAVKRNDVETMDRILHPHFVLVRGDGRVVTREEAIEGARGGAFNLKCRTRSKARRPCAPGATLQWSRPCCGSGDAHGRAFRPARLVQRHLCQDGRRVALRICASAGCLCRSCGTGRYRGRDPSPELAMPSLSSAVPNAPRDGGIFRRCLLVG